MSFIKSKGYKTNNKKHMEIKNFTDALKLASALGDEKAKVLDDVTSAMDLCTIMSATLSSRQEYHSLCNWLCLHASSRGFYTPEEQDLTMKCLSSINDCDATLSRLSRNYIKDKVLIDTIPPLY